MIRRFSVHCALSALLCFTALAACGGDDDDSSGAQGSTHGFDVIASGEDLVTVGYGFTAGTSKAEDPAFVDGWSVEFTHLIVTYSNIRLNDNPDKSADDPSQMDGVVAHAEGPFAVDLRKAGDATGKSGEDAVKLTTIAKRDDGGAFATDTRYALSYDIVAASDSATQVNLDAEGKTLYTEAVAKGYSVVFAGVATYKGPAPEAGTVFAKMPKKVNFTFAMKSPTSYLNCQNTDLQPNGDEFPRGVQVLPNANAVVQLTYHTDHGFWDELNVEGTPLHFDPFAANASSYGTPDMDGTVTLDDLDAVDFTALKTKDGEPLPARSLVSDYTAPAGSLSYNPNGTTIAGNSFAKYFTYSAASGGHLNADGECLVKRN